MIPISVIHQTTKDTWHPMALVELQTNLKQVYSQPRETESNIYRRKDYKNKIGSNFSSTFFFLEIELSSTQNTIIPTSSARRGAGET